MSRLCLFALTSVARFVALSGWASSPLLTQSADFPKTSYPNWCAQDAAYRFYPGDKFRVGVRIAPITLPTIGAIMAGGHTTSELKLTIENIYANELRVLSLVITLTNFGSQKVFVGGEVKAPGVLTLPDEIDVLRAIILAGGWTDDGKRTHVVDMRNGLARKDPSDLGQLQRFDVVYVSRKMIADENLLVKQFIRDALPIDFSLFYDVARFRSGLFDEPCPAYGWDMKIEALPPPPLHAKSHADPTA